MDVRDKNCNNDRPEDAASDSNKLRWQRSSKSAVITDQAYEEQDKRMVGVANQTNYDVDCKEYVTGLEKPRTYCTLLVLIL